MDIFSASVFCLFFCSKIAKIDISVSVQVVLCTHRGNSVPRTWRGKHGIHRLEPFLPDDLVFMSSSGLNLFGSVRSYRFSSGSREILHAPPHISAAH